jgi:dienelactone hydrolase
MENPVAWARRGARGLGAVFLICLGVLGSVGMARAQQEIPPPQGKGPVVVVVSGALGAAHYISPAQQIAALGYDVILLDGNAMSGSQGQALMTQVQNAQNAPHGLPGKVAVVGFSLGGGEALAYASRWPDLVSVIVAWYPLTTPIRDIPTFVAGIKVPVLMFAGALDDYKGCCLIGTAQSLGAAAAAQKMPLTVIEYPSAGHDFVIQGKNYDAAAAQDSWQRAKAELAEFSGH